MANLLNKTRPTVFNTEREIQHGYIWWTIPNDESNPTQNSFTTNRVLPRTCQSSTWSIYAGASKLCLGSVAEAGYVGVCSSSLHQSIYTPKRFTPQDTSSIGVISQPEEHSNFLFADEMNSHAMTLPKIKRKLGFRLLAAPEQRTKHHPLLHHTQCITKKLRSCTSVMHPPTYFFRSYFLPATCPTVCCLPC